MIEILGGRKVLYQWDINQRLVVDTNCTEVHFAHAGDDTAAVVLPKDENEKRLVDIPNIYLQKSVPLLVYVYITTGNESHTVIHYELSVLQREKPESYVYEETETLNYANLDKRLKDLEGEGLANAVADYLKENPVEAGATKEEAEQIAKNKTDIEKLSNDKLDADKLPEAVNDALAQAKSSGDFKGEPGDDYVLTEADKQEIAEQAAEMVDVPSGGADWNQNDENGAGYVKGRTHYEYVASTVIQAESTATYSVSNGRKYAQIGVNNATSPWWGFLFSTSNDGNTYYVMFDGKEYEAVYRGETVGNQNIYDGSLTNTGEPFCIRSEAYGVVRCYVATTDTDTHTFGIYERVVDIKQLDEKYIPDTIARVSDIPDVDTMQPLTFTGAVNVTYDGSEAVSVEIPEGGGGGASAGWELIGEAISDGTSPVGGIYVPVNFAEYTEIFVTAHTVAKVFCRLILSKSTNWYDGTYVNSNGTLMSNGAVIGSGDAPTQALLLQTSIKNIAGELFSFSGWNSGYAGQVGTSYRYMTPVASPRGNTLAEKNAYVRMDTNNSTDNPSVPEGNWIKVYGRK